MTPGGSSGGEGALLAMRGSPLGVGTDIGGCVYCFTNTACTLLTLRTLLLRVPGPVR